MKREEIDRLILNNVRQEVDRTDYIKILFETHEFPYRMHVIKNKNGIFVPQAIHHYDVDLDEGCKLCNNNAYRMDKCLNLSNELPALFHRLIEQPSIRLEWLYLPHV